MLLQHHSRLYELAFTLQHSLCREHESLKERLLVFLLFHLGLNYRVIDDDNCKGVEFVTEVDATLTQELFDVVLYMIKQRALYLQFRPTPRLDPLH